MDIRIELEELVREISEKNTYAGNKIPESVMKLFEIEVRENGGGVLVPFWLAVLQKGRGPRKTTTDYQLYTIIYRWMAKHGLFKSRTEKGRLNEAKSVTWYINKYGNKHFRSGVFVDIYETARKNFIDKINLKYGSDITKITMEVL
jgi:hypothetical protein